MKTKENVKKCKYSNLYYIVMIILFLSFFFIFLIMSQNKKLKTISVSEKGNIDYSVCVKENDYYSEKCLDKGMQYIANLIDYIDINFDYDLLTDVKVDYDYKYRIEAKVNVFAKNDPSNIIYTDTKKLLETKLQLLENSKNLELKKNVKINYSEYNDLVRKFKNEYGVNADSNIEVKVYIEPTINYEEFEEKIKREEVILELSIPLTENQINIKAVTQDINNTKKYKKEVTEKINNIYLVGSIISGIIALSFIISFILNLASKERNKSPYRKEVDKILREYDYIISESDTIIDPDEKEYKYTDMKSFKDLKEMAITTNKQIITSELKELKKSPRTWFYIVDENNKRIYRFAIYSNKNSEDEKHAKKKQKK